jgi:hypothetical protein
VLAAMACLSYLDLCTDTKTSEPRLLAQLKPETRDENKPYHGTRVAINGLARSAILRLDWILIMDSFVTGTQYVPCVGVRVGLKNGLEGPVRHAVTLQ